MEMYSKLYFLIRPINSNENRRFQSGSTSFAYTYDTSLKPRKIRVANHIRFLSQTQSKKYILIFLRKSNLKPHSWQNAEGIHEKLKILTFFLTESEDWGNYCFEVPSWKISYFCLVFMLLYAIPVLQLIISCFPLRVTHGTEKLWYKFWKLVLV